MSIISSKKELFKFFQKESLRVGFLNLSPFILSKSSLYLAKKLTHLTNGFATNPIVINFYLTELCNLNCKMCFLKQIDSEKKLMGFNIIKKVTKELIYLRPRYNFTGGEPFLHPEIEKLITHIKSKGLYLSIVTNGTLIKNFAEIIVRSGVDKLAISIDGRPEKHDLIRRSPGAFSKTLKGIQAINHEKIRQNKRRPRLSLYSLLNTDTDEDFIISFAQENFFTEINFIHLLSISSDDLKRFSDNWKTEPHYWKGAVINNQGFKISESLFKKIKAYASDPKVKIKIRFTPDIKTEDLNNYYNKNKDFLNKFKGNCVVPWISATIKPPAKVEICPDFPVGDLTHNSFLKIWNGEKSRKVRKQIAGGTMFSICNGCCNYYV